MSFFEPPPAPNRPEPPFEIPQLRPWWQPPRNELGAAVALRLVLARTERVAIALNGATAFSTGALLKLTARKRLDPDDLEAFYEDPLDHPLGHPASRHRRGGSDLPPEILRFGVQFSDGGKATTLSEMPFPSPGDPQDEPSGPVLAQRGGSGGGGEWDWDFWLWPVPRPGQMTFAVQWPKEGIELTKQEVDASLFIDASRYSERLWPDAGVGGPGGSYTVDQLVLRAKPAQEDEGPASG